MLAELVCGATETPRQSTALIASSRNFTLFSFLTVGIYSGNLPAFGVTNSEMKCSLKKLWRAKFYMITKNCFLWHGAHRESARAQIAMSEWRSCLRNSINRSPYYHPTNSPHITVLQPLFYVLSERSGRALRAAGHVRSASPAHLPTTAQTMSGECLQR